jgi:hypothetical protein
MIRRFLAWVRALRFVVANYMRDIHYLNSNLSALEKILRDRTDISVDVGVRGENTIIVTGRYRKADYVEVFSIGDMEMNNLIHLLRQMQQYATVKRIDAPISFKGVFPRHGKGEW